MSLVISTDSEQDQLIINGNNPTNYGLESDLAIAWIGLKFYGRKNVKTITLLNDINGSIELRTITALMGPSGAGKSTLLKCINGRQISGIDGNTDIYLNAGKGIRSCFIVQDVKEHLLYGLTALQSLVYASKLKNSAIKKCDHKLNAQNLLRELSIPHIGNTSVQKCSGGEQKRLAIALELTSVEKPNLLCIDEPTSGLDSFAAEEVINCLKDVTQRHGIAVVTSIHQPNNEIIMKFDKLYVLAKGGICIYEGPPRNLPSHLREAEIILNQDQVPIEVLIKISSRSNGRDDESATRMQSIMSDKRQTLQSRCLSEGQQSNGISMKGPRINFTHMWYLMLRACIYSVRYRIWPILFQTSMIIGLAFLLTKLFNANLGIPDGCMNPNVTKPCNQTPDSLKVEKWLSQNERLQFFALLALQFLITVPTVLIFTNEVRLFYNEHKNGWYSTGSYFWAKTVVELPLCLVTTFGYAYIVYVSNNQISDAFRLKDFMLTMALGAVTAQGLGFTIGVIADSDEKLANILSVGVYLFNLLLCGFFAPIEELPDYLKWITYLSFAKQCFEMQMYIIYGFDRCPAGQVSQILYQMKIVEQDKFNTNRNMLISHAIIIRIIALVILLIKANQYKCEELIIKIKRLKRLFRSNRNNYTPIY